MNNPFLRNQLKDMGSSKDESRRLADLANELNSITPPLGKATKNRIANEIGFKPTNTIPKLRLSLAGAMAIFVMLIVLAQSATPGSVLYALKRGSEEVRVLVQPGFDDSDIQQRRDEEKVKINKQLEIEDKSTPTNDDESSSQKTEDRSKNKRKDNKESEDSKSKTSDDSRDRSTESDRNSSNEERSEDSLDD